MPTARDAQRQLAALADPEHALRLASYFRAGPGGYGEGDRFRGLRVPQVRAVGRRFRDLPLDALADLLASRFHEDRFLAVTVLVDQARRAPARLPELHAFYLAHRRGIDNWDLVDVSAPTLMAPLDDDEVGSLSHSGRVWDRRIAILAHAPVIAAGDAARFLRFVVRFIDDPHDLIHKAAGWMLRECGKADAAALAAFLDAHAAHMPRTMLRYAIERLPVDARARYMRR